MKVAPLYIWSLFLDPSTRRELGARSSGTSGSMKNISKPKVMSMKVTLPPLPLQRAFATRVAEVRAMEVEQAQSRRRLDDLFQSLLYEHFSLVEESHSISLWM
jgi:type I restriction enzyme, S subunit